MAKLAIMLTILLLSAGFLCCIQIQVTNAQLDRDSTIHILPDGTITPSTAPIERIGSIYKVTANLNTTIVVEKNNIIVDGQGFTSQEMGVENGQAAINLTCTGTTVKNFHINGWQVGVLGAFDNNMIVGNDFTGNSYDVAVYGKNYEITKNHLSYVRIQGSNIHVFENQFQTRKWGSAFWISNSTDITIEANEFTFTSDTTSFISIDSTSDILVFHNNFLSPLVPSKGQSYFFSIGGVSELEPWDNGFPSGGNYWCDFTSKYDNASMIGNTGIWNQTYVISDSRNVVDRYPLYNPYNIDAAALQTPPPTETPTNSPAPSVPELPIWALIMLVTFASTMITLKKIKRKPMGTVYA